MSEGTVSCWYKYYLPLNHFLNPGFDSSTQYHNVSGGIHPKALWKKVVRYDVALIADDPQDYHR